MSIVKPGSKYRALFDHLRRQRADRVVLTFDQIQSLIPTGLPPSARAGKAFWSNRSRGALQASAWLEAGYRVTAVDLAEEAVTFDRLLPRYAVRPEDGNIVWDGALIRALRNHLGLNQAGLAEVLGVRQQTVSEWETGAYAPTRASAKHLALVAERARFPYWGKPPRRLGGPKKVSS